MKNSLMVYGGIAVLLIVAFCIGGFIVFNKKLTESKQIKEAGDISTQRSIPAEILQTNQQMSAAENSLLLQITSPSDGSIVQSPTITLRGKTVAGADVFINDKETVSDANGDFSVGLTLEEGDNPIMVVANDQEGNVGEQEITVSYELTE